MSILHEAIYRFSAVPFKIPAAFFTEIEKTMLKICVEPQKSPQIGKAVFRKKNLEASHFLISNCITEL